MRQVVKYNPLSILLSLLLLVTACDRRQLEVMEPTHAQIRIDVDWLKYFGTRPNGMTVMIWGDDWERPLTSSTNNVESMKVELDPGHYRLLVFNKSFDEFGSMKFTGTDSYELVAARGTNITQYQNGEWDKGVVYMPDPEDIGVVKDEFTITEEMLLEQVNFYPYEEWIAQRYANTRWMIEPDGTYSMTVEAKPQTTKLNVWVQIKGIENMRSIVGSITGMADGFYLSQVWRTTEERPMLFETSKWLSLGTSETDSLTYMFYSLPVFGLPHGKEYVAQRTEENNVLTLHIELIDGTSRTYTYNVGKLIRYRGLEESLEAGLEAGLDATIEANLETSLLLELQLDLVINIETVDNIPVLPKVNPVDPKSSSGFDAHVDPWEDGGTVDVGL